VGGGFTLEEVDVSAPEAFHRVVITGQAAWSSEQREVRRGAVRCSAVRGACDGGCRFRVLRRRAAL